MIRNRSELRPASRRGVLTAAIRTLAMLLLLTVTTSPAIADAAFARWLEALRPEAERLGVSRSTFDAAFDGISPDRSLPDLQPAAQQAPSKGQAEFVKSPGAYLDEAMIQRLVVLGRDKAAPWQSELAAIEAAYGVPRNVVLAIWGRETNYGTVKLPHNAIRVLVTQAYLGRRKAVFREELLAALKILEEGHVSRDRMASSWAGAMGNTQFMPTHFRDFAVDFDGDGHKDIWTSVPDSLASTARSLQDPKANEDGDLEWRKGVTWGFEVRPPAAADCTLQGLDNMRPLRDWVALGYRRAYGRDFPRDRLDEPAFLMMPEGSDGPAFLLTRNFLVIKSYNYADLYALFVGHLADRLAGGKPFETPWADTKPLREASVMELQKGLVGLGYDVGKLDGKVGWRTRLATGLFEKRAGLRVDCYPTADDVAAIASFVAAPQ